jgi:hypothetical protein
MNLIERAQEFFWGEHPRKKYIEEELGLRSLYNSKDPRENDFLRRKLLENRIRKRKYIADEEIDFYIGKRIPTVISFGSVVTSLATGEPTFLLFTGISEFWRKDYTPRVTQQPQTTTTQTKTTPIPYKEDCPKDTKPFKKEGDFDLHGDGWLYNKDPDD